MKRNVSVLLICFLLAGCNGSESKPRVSHKPDSNQNQEQENNPAVTPSTEPSYSNPNQIQSGQTYSPQTPVPPFGAAPDSTGYASGSNSARGPQGTNSNSPSSTTNQPAPSASNSNSGKTSSGQAKSKKTKPGNKPESSSTGVVTADKTENSSEEITQSHLSSSNSHTLFVKTGNIYSWGDEGAWLGAPTGSKKTRPARIFNETLKFKFVAAGEKRSTAITKDGKLIEWEPKLCANPGCAGLIKLLRPAKVLSRQLWNTFQGEPIPASVALGPDHTAVVTEEGFLYTWGAGKEGKLGQFDETSYTDLNGFYGNEADYPSAEARPVPFFYNNSIKITSVALGKDYSAAISEDHNLYTWGNGRFMKLGHGDGQNAYAPAQVTYFDRNVKSVALGFDTSAAITTNDDLYVWGKTFDSKDRSIVLDKNIQPLLSKVKLVALGETHAAAIALDGDLYTWGRNSQKQLGREDNDSYTPGRVNLPGNVRAVAVSVGSDYTVAVCENGKIFTWGKGKDISEVILDEKPASKATSAGASSASTAPVQKPAPAPAQAAAPTQPTPVTAEITNPKAEESVPLWRQIGRAIKHPFNVAWSKFWNLNDFVEKNAAFDRH